METFKIIFPVYVCGMYIVFAWLTCKNYKSGQEGHPFFNAVVSYIWPLIVVLLPLGLLLYWIKRFNENNIEMKKKNQSTPIQKFVQDAKIATYLKYMDKFGEDDKTKWLDVLYVIREDVNKNIQRLEKYNK